MAELLDGLTTSGILSKQYRTQWAGKRSPLVVRLPDGSDFLLDGGRRENGRIRTDGQGYTLKEADGRYSVQEILDNGRWRGYLRDNLLIEESQFLAEQKKKAAQPQQQQQQQQQQPVHVEQFRQG